MSSPSKRNSTLSSPSTLDSSPSKRNSKRKSSSKRQSSSRRNSLPASEGKISPEISPSKRRKLSADGGDKVDAYARRIADRQKTAEFCEAREKKQARRRRREGKRAQREAEREAEENRADGDEGGEADEEPEEELGDLGGTSSSGRRRMGRARSNVVAVRTKGKRDVVAANAGAEDSDDDDDLLKDD